MSVKKTISIPDELERGIDLYNRKNPYCKLNISQIAQQAVYDKISKDAEVKQLVDSVSVEPVSLVELFSEPVVINEKGLTCKFCKKPFSPKSPKAVFCSDKCKSADYRMRKKSKMTQ